MKNIKNRIIISYPYGGFSSEKEFKEHFIGILKVAQKCDSEEVPIVIFNMDSEKIEKQRAEESGQNNYSNYLLNYYHKCQKVKEPFKIVKMISSDTCVMWLRGWEEVIKWAEKEKLDDDSIRVVIIPGDIQIDIHDERREFKNELGKFCRFKRMKVDIYIGDYEVEVDSAKELIDKHGTYPLLANWFPDFYKFIVENGIRRPRSEFLNIKLSTLKKYIIGPRKFSYEQTLKLLLQCWNKKESVESHNLGKVTDEKGFRALLGVMEQIERMERMIKMLWRDYRTDEIKTNYNENINMIKELKKLKDKINKDAWQELNLNGAIKECELEDKPVNPGKLLMERYNQLDSKSTLIRNSSIITIDAMLDWLNESHP